MTRTLRRSSFPALFRAVAGLAGVALVSLLSGGALAEATTPRVAANFDQPSALAVTNGNLWVANAHSNSLTELSAAGSVTRTVAGAAFGFATPQALAAVAGNLFVANRSNSVVEVAGATGKFVRRLSDAKYHFGDPVALATVGADLWVVNSTGSSLTEINAVTGALVRTVTNVPFSPVRFDEPSALAVAGAHLWIANAGNSSLTEISSSTGAVIRTVRSGVNALSTPAGVAFDGTHLWVSNSASNSVTELNGSTGALVQVITNSSRNANYGFNAPSVVYGAAGFIYVVSPPGGSPMVTQIDPSTGDSRWMMCNTNYPFNFLGPAAVAINGAELWVANRSNNTLSEMNAITGEWIKNVS